jgi:hypothetical protein
MTIEQLKYPIGQFEKPSEITQEILNKWISDVSTFPKKLLSEVMHLTNEQLDTPYRLNGWTIRQVVPLCRQSYEQFNSFKTCIDRRPANNKTIF